MLKLIDITGKEVAVLVNEEKSKGEYEYMMNLSGLSPGTYMYRIEAGGYVDSRTVVVQ